MSRAVKHTLSFLGVLAVLATPAVPVAAQVIHSNGVPDNYNGVRVNGGVMTADDFPLTSPTQLGSFDWYVLRAIVSPTTTTSPPPPTITSNFTWAIYGDASGLPGSTPLGNGTVTNATGNLTPFFCCSGGTHEFDTYLFSGVSFGGLSLGTGQYWLAIGNYLETVPGNPGEPAYWASSSEPGNAAYSIDGGATWAYSPVSQEVAFTIYGTGSTVPEPGSLALLATGLLGLVPTFKRRLKL